MPGRADKSLNEKTAGEIIAMIIAFLVIGIFIIAASVTFMARSHWALSVILWNSIGILIVTVMWLKSLPAAIRELRRRRSKR